MKEEQDKRELDVSQLSFEQAMEQLVAIVEELEDGKLGLDDALARYELGIKLVRHCRQILQTAEKRVHLLIQEENGELRLEEFNPEEAETIADATEETPPEKPKTRARRSRSGGDDRRSLIGGAE